MQSNAFAMHFTPRVCTWLPCNRLGNDGGFSCTSVFWLLRLVTPARSVSRRRKRWKNGAHPLLLQLTQCLLYSAEASNSVFWTEEFARKRIEFGEEKIYFRTIFTGLRRNCEWSMIRLRYYEGTNLGVTLVSFGNVSCRQWDRKLGSSNVVILPIAAFRFWRWRSHFVLNERDLSNNNLFGHFGPRISRTHSGV